MRELQKRWRNQWQNQECDSRSQKEQTLLTETKEPVHGHAVQRAFMNCECRGAPFNEPSTAGFPESNRLMRLFLAPVAPTQRVLSSHSIMSLGTCSILTSLRSVGVPCYLATSWSLDSWSRRGCTGRKRRMVRRCYGYYIVYSRTKVGGSTREKQSSLLGAYV